MKQTLLTFATLLCFAIGLNAQNTIKLDEPNKQRGISIMQAFENRKSIIEFQDKALSIADLSDLLWAANGINRPDMGKRTAPSAQNSQDIDIYVALEKAVYLYDAKTSSLNLVAEGDYRDLATKKAGETVAPCILYLVADASRYGANNELKHILEMNRVDAGIVSQNISIFCAGTGLGTRPRARMNHDGLKTALKLTDSQQPILNHPVGYPK